MRAASPYTAPSAWKASRSDTFMPTAERAVTSATRSAATFVQGFATEAGLAFIGALAQDGFPYITATHDQNNPASGAVMRKLGMDYRYSYRELWQPKNVSVVFCMYQKNFDGSDFVYRGYWDKFPHWTDGDACD